MGQTLHKITLHLVFSTKHREPFIAPPMQPRLYAYMGAVATDHDSTLLAAGGMPDHVHLLLALKTIARPADVVQNIKAHSSR